MQYAVTFIEKLATEDHYENGCDPDTTRTVIADKVDIVADSMAELLERIDVVYGIGISAEDSSLDVMEFPTSSFGFNRMETLHCGVPTQQDEREFKAGNKTLYLCDYIFAVERRETSPVTAEDFAHVKTH